MRRSISMLAALSLAATLAGIPIGATAAPKPSIEDPEGDANGINDQGTNDGSFGDFVTPADASDFADIVSVSFSNNKKDLFVHIKTVSTAQPTAGEGFRVRTNPDGPGGVYCLNFEIFFNGAQNDLTGWQSHLRDACAGDELIEAEAALDTMGGFTITVPRKAHEALGKGKSLTAAQAQTFVWSGSSYPAGVAGPYLDTTKPGTDYKIKK